jgi:RES domain-containing protein
VAFDGEGARVFGGRWNHRGTPVVYTSATLSLAVMELLVHLDDEDVGKDYVGIPAEIPDSVGIRHVRAPELPRDWRSLPTPQALAGLGTRWAVACGTAVLAVPSAIIPQELNYLLSPRHPHFTRIRVGRPEPFFFDPRLRKR